jgi:hypothetical protein
VAFDTRVRLALYERFVADGRAPSTAEVAEELDAALEAVEASFRRLEEARVIVLAPGTLNVWMANPLSAVPTAFRVETPRGAFWGNCSWDGLGVVAMLGGEGTVTTECPDCAEPIALEVSSGELAREEGVAHFAVPAARWWENIGFT